MNTPRNRAPNALRAAGSVAYDFYAFTLFLVFLVLVFAVGAPLRGLDALLGTRLLDRLVHLFEFCGGL